MKETITKYLEGRASKSEQLKLLQWLRSKNNRYEFDSQKLDWEKAQDKEQLPLGSEKSWNVILGHVLQKSYNRWQDNHRINLLFRIAAIFFFIVSVAGATYYITNTTNTDSNLITQVVAANGQISEVQLPDGSVVWLNSDSKVSYNNSFGLGNRNIKLTGEAYFQVTKNKDLPLIVNSGEIKVKVLGTRFNVMAYPESEYISVVLESGKVQLLHNQNENFDYKLQPGEMASYKKAQKELVIKNIDTKEYTDWKQGSLIFRDTPMREVIQRLERKFNIDIEVKNQEVYKSIFNARFADEDLNEILEYIQYSCPINYEITDEKNTKGTIIILYTRK